MRKNKYILIACLLLIFDLGLTWYFLNFSEEANEGNPLFNIDGGYLVLFINLLYLITIFILERFVIRRYETILIEATNSYDYFGKIFKTKRIDFIPTSLAFAFIFSTFASRFTAIIDWLVFGIYKGRFYDTKYALLRAKMPFGRYDLIVVIVSFFIFLIAWYKLEYKKSKKEDAN